MMIGYRARAAGVWAFTVRRYCAPQLNEMHKKLQRAAAGRTLGEFPPAPPSRATPSVAPSGRASVLADDTPQPSTLDKRIEAIKAIAHAITAGVRLCFCV